MLEVDFTSRGPLSDKQDEHEPCEHPSTQNSRAHLTHLFGVSAEDGIIVEPLAKARLLCEDSEGDAHG